MVFSKSLIRSFALTSLAVASVAGCGGVDSLYVKGVSAEGPALVGATVTATCAGGGSSAPVTTNADGSYLVAVIDGAAPCIVTATKGNVSYQAVTAGSGSALTVNVTPISTIVVELLKKEFVGVGATSSTLINNAAAKAALAGSASTFAAALSSAMTASAATNPIAAALAGQFTAAELQTVLTGSFTPAKTQTSNDGDAIDGKLDLVVTQLTNGGFITNGVVNTANVQTAVATIDVPLAGSTGATGGTGATGSGN